MSTFAVLAATAALAFLLGRLSCRPKIRTLRAKITYLAGQVGALDGQLRIARYLAGHDRLTGLPNRSLAAAHFAAHEVLGHPTIVALVDLDNFKEINDCYSHHAGDDLLRTVAERLTLAAKTHGGTASRLSGDEFLLLLPANGEDQAAPVAAILNLVSAPAALRTGDGEVTVHPTASAGIAVYDGAHGSFETMLHHADVALYHAKQEPGGQRIYRPDMRMPRNMGRHGPRRRDHRPADGRQPGSQVTR